jgi:hypothetical protein
MQVAKHGGYLGWRPGLKTVSERNLGRIKNTALSINPLVVENPETCSGAKSG